MDEEIKFSTDVVERACRFGMTDCDGEFYALSNFKIDVLSEIQAAEYSGFTFKVTLYTGEALGDAFYTEEQASTGRKKWLHALMSSISNYTLKCTATSVQINGYLMRKYEQFIDGPNHDCKIAVNATGLQKGREKIWVLNADVQYGEDGDLVDIDSSLYIWLGHFSGNKEASGIQIPQKQASCAQSKTRKTAGWKLVQSLEQCYPHNFPACLLVLGAEVLCLHYETLMAAVKHVPVTIVFGEVGQGNSKATRGALSLLGVQEANYFQELTDHRALKLTAHTILGVVIDDPSDHHSIAEIIHHFEQGTHSSHIPPTHQGRPS